MQRSRSVSSAEEVRTTTGVRSARPASTSSISSPESPGMKRSRTTQSGGRSAIRSSACSPSIASITSKPADERIARQYARDVFESSTIRTSATRRPPGGTSSDASGLCPTRADATTWELDAPTRRWVPWTTTPWGRSAAPRTARGAAPSAWQRLAARSPPPVGERERLPLSARGLVGPRVTLREGAVRPQLGVPEAVGEVAPDGDPDGGERSAPEPLQRRERREEGRVEVPPDGQRSPQELERLERPRDPLRGHRPDPLEAGLHDRAEVGRAEPARELLEEPLHGARVARLREAGLDEEEERGVAGGADARCERLDELLHGGGNGVDVEREAQEDRVGPAELADGRLAPGGADEVMAADHLAACGGEAPDNGVEEEAGVAPRRARRAIKQEQAHRRPPPGRAPSRRRARGWI